MIKRFCDVCKKEIVGEDYSIAELHIGNDYGDIETAIHICDDCVPNVEKLLNVEFPRKRTIFDDVAESITKMVSVLSRSRAEIDDMEVNNDEPMP